MKLTKIAVGPADPVTVLRLLRSHRYSVANRHETRLKPSLSNGPPPSCNQLPVVRLEPCDQFHTQDLPEKKENFYWINQIATYRLKSKSMMEFSRNILANTSIHPEPVTNSARRCDFGDHQQQKRN